MLVLQEMSDQRRSHRYNKEDLLTKIQLYWQFHTPRVYMKRYKKREAKMCLG